MWPNKRPVVFEVQPESSIQLYGELRDYAWIDAWLRCRDIRAKIAPLEEERKQIGMLPSSKDSIIDRLKLSFEKIKQDRIAWIRTYILESWEDVTFDPRFFERRATSSSVIPLPRFLGWREIEQALDEIPEVKNAISDEHRESKLEKLEREIANLKIDLKQLSPERYFLKSGAKVVGDARDELVKKWWNVQNQLSGPCNPFGRILEASQKPEQKAWKQLGINSAVNPYGRFVPGK